MGFAVFRSVALTKRLIPPSLPIAPSRSSSGNSNPVSRVTEARKASTVGVRVIGNSWAPSRATAAATRVTALSSATIDPCPARPVAVRVAQATPFSAAATR